MAAFFTWLAGTKAARVIMTIGAAGAALFVVILKIFNAGKASQQAAQDRASLEAYRNREKIDETVSRQSDADARADLSRWVRKDRAR